MKFILFSACKTGKWNCSSDACGATLRCPNNLIFSRNVTPCDLLTCKNADSVKRLRERGDCDVEAYYDGCTCPDGLLIQVKLRLRFQNVFVLH